MGPRPGICEKGGQNSFGTRNSTHSEGLRAFGNRIAITEVAKGRSGQTADTLNRVEESTAAQQSRRGESGGKDPSGGSKETRRGPDMVTRFQGNVRAYGGSLPRPPPTSTTSDTEKLFTITTNQGDSEILLIEDNTVYYRVSDRPV